ncbi:MAG: polymer-forming cytoskeletal protein [Lachnospiraceae bacterium]|nr:polymer-forming cytoskeletal protein [Lachnospiraceae bacterium]
MGFFSDLKEDLAQAVNELTEDAAEKELLEEEERLKKELAEMEDELQVNGIDMQETVEEEYAHFMAEEAVFEDVNEDEYVEAQMQNSNDSTDSFESVNEEVMASLAAGYADATEALPDEENSLVEELEAAVAELDETVEVDEIEELEEIEEIEEKEEMVTMMAEDVMEVSDRNDDTMMSMADENAEVGIIPAGMIITGDISTAGALDLRGTVLGNIEIGGKLNVSGSIQGNSKAVEIYAQAAKITGDIECDNSVKVGPNSVVIGNVSARSAVIAGAVKGDIDVRGPVILDSSAIIKGNIKSKSVQINNGAAIEGMCSQCYADVNPTSFFDGLE